MRMKIEVEIKPFIVPNFIRVNDGNSEGDGRAIAIKDADPDVLSMLCDTFREEIFAKSGKKDPRLV